MDTFVIFLILSLFILLTVSLRSIPMDGYGVLEQWGKIHIIYQKPGIHFVIPLVQSMYLYDKHTTLEFNRVLLESDNRFKMRATLRILHEIMDIKPYHTMVKDTSLHVDLLKVMQEFVSACQWDPNHLKNDLNQYLSTHFEKSNYPFKVQKIEIIELELV